MFIYLKMKFVWAKVLYNRYYNKNIIEYEIIIYSLRGRLIFSFNKQELKQLFKQVEELKKELNELKFYTIRFNIDFTFDYYEFSQLINILEKIKNDKIRSKYLPKFYTKYE